MKFFLFVIDGSANIESFAIHGTLRECIEVQRQLDHNIRFRLGMSEPRFVPRRFSIRKAVQRSEHGHI